MHGGGKAPLAGGQVVRARAAPGLGNGASVGAGQGGMGNQRVLRPLGEDDIQAQGVIGGQRVSHQGCNLPGQFAAGLVSLPGNISLQLELTKPQHQQEHRQ